MTFSELINKCDKTCKKLGIDEPKTILFQLLYFISKKVKNMNDFATNSRKEIDFGEKEYIELIARYYEDLEPLGIIVGKIDFLNTVIKVNNNVLVPRNETEELASKVIELVNKNKVKKTIDLCCGSGCLAIAIAKNTKSKVFALDLSKDCVELTKENSIVNNVDVDVKKADLFKFVSKNKVKYDCVVCNPPYVSMTELDERMLKHEPKMAFNNGNEYAFYDAVISNYKKLTTDKFIIAFEIGYQQRKKLTSILKDNGLLKYSKFSKDLNGSDRFLIIKNY
jgi:release factor glutamine methyltransferase